MSKKSNNLINQIEQVMNALDGMKQSTSKRYEKLRIALSGTHRLLSSEKSTLARVSGKPQDLMRYVIAMVDTLERETLNDLRTLRDELRTLLSTAQNHEAAANNIGTNERE